MVLKKIKISHKPDAAFEGQLDDEEVLYVFRRHPIVMRRGLIYGSLGLLAGPLTTLVLTYTNSANPPTMTFFCFSVAASGLLAALLFFPAWLSWYFSVFVVTNQRFMQVTQKGFFHRSVSDIGLDLILSLNYEIQGVEQTMLGFGTIVMQTYVGDMKMHYIHHPARTQQVIADILRQQGYAPSGVANSAEANHEDS